MCEKYTNKSSCLLHDIVSLLFFFCSAVSSPRVWQTAAAAQLLVAGAAHAEAGKLFDFDLTLPIMVAQFLLLMKFLDSKLFTPVGNIMDERAKGVKIIRAALSEKQEARNAASNENKKLLDQGRAAADAYVKGMQKKAMEQVEEMVNENKKEIEAEVAVASASVMAKVKIAEDKLIAEKPVIVQLVIDKLAGKTVMKELSTPETLPSEEVKEPATVEV